ncbi:YadA-like family protein [Cupriavidus alkaliphilus]|uniref:YadA-like family protein n=1 Tax=Cupriavidus alkaliphilus TaxID=942866 RepID=UPI001615C825|nr:YadA-like family protein [Cupriavidus alkaliphilus]MBB3013245.1 autotransporter adhesin [Cupriavidus alkaliphilus]
MNKAFRLIWNESLGGWVAVSETAMGRGKGAGGTRRIHLLARRAGLAAALVTVALASGVAQANFVGDGGSANGTKAIAIGNGANTGGSNSTGGVAIGAGAQSSAGNADGNIAIGENAKNLNQIGGGGAIVIGRNATILNYYGNPLVTGAGSLVIGDGASSYGVNTVVLGAGANVNHSTNIAIGYQATGTGNGGVVALGKGSNATGDNSVAIGGSAVVTGTNGMAIGNGSQAAANATSLGAVATALGANATAIGQQATAATNGTAVGTAARANGANAMAVGNAASAEASATAIGTAAKASGTNSTALGNGASATANNSVAIGAGSRTATTLPATGGYNPGNTALSGTAPFSEASFGTAGQERLLTNVAAGQLATDAVNVSQLMSASDKIDHAGSSVAAALGGGAAYDPTSGSISAPTFNLGSNGTYSNVGDAMSSLFNTGTKYFHANSAGADSQATGTNSVAIGVGAVSANADDVALGANAKTAAAVATTGATIGGTAYTFAGTAPASTVSVGDVGAERTVTNMAAGRLSATSTDGVNGSQLYATNQAVNQIQTHVETLGDQSVKYDTNADGTVNYNAVTLAGAVSSDGGKTGGTRIRNVAQGEVSATSADAVNGAQLYAVQGDITNLGDDIDNIYEKGTRYFHANSTGLDSQALGMNAIAIGMNAISLGANALAAGANANAAGTNALALGAGAQAGNAGDVALGAGSKTAAAVGTASATIGGNTYNFAGASPTSTVSVGDVGSERTITNVAAGRLDGNSTDAVNGSQLAATNQAVNAISTTVNTLNDRAVQYGVNSDGTVDYSTVTLAGTKSSDGGKTGGTRIANLSQGDLSATSTDAVNGAQLYETNQNVTNLTNDVNNIYNTGSKYFHANSTGVDSVASGADSVAVGTGAVANNAGDVALGANSVTAAAVATTGTTINGQRYNYAGTSPTSTVSVGDAGSERTITNVAAGRVSATSTDAVNGSQLYATDQAIESLAGKAVQYDTNADGTVNYNSVTMGATASQDGGKTGGTRIRNVAQGDVSAISTDAVNGAQLYNITGDTSATYITENGTGIKYVRTNDTGLPAADAHAQGEGATAVGYEAVAAARNDVATGYRALASGGNSVAQGANAQATGNAAVALGSGAVATGANSVALGAGSAASRDNSVSVGAVGNERQITNVAAGTADTDAVNVSQLQQTQSMANSYTDQQIGNVRKDAYGGTASAMAMAALPQSTLPGKGMAAIAGGTYGGQSAMALGLSAMSDSGRWVYRANATTNTRGNVGVAVGAGFHW